MPEVHHLPPELSRFVGREQELASIEAALARDRVVSLVGPGGCGKSRLAMRVAADQAPRWADGAWWVDLALETESDRAAHRIATALDVPLPDETEPLATLAGELGDTARLLVLDNCEHLLSDLARLVATLLARCPRIGMLATSQAPLGITGERVWRVPPMSLDDGLELFLVRAGVDEVDAGVRSGARRVCDRLDRMPLALELAAGWADTLSPQQIAESLADPLAMLDGGPRDAPFRQQTLEGSMRWSHALLDDDERVLFRRLAAFEAGFGADTVREVCGYTGLAADRTLPALRGLIDKSLVVADPTGPTARYGLLGVVQAYARARLDEAGESDAVHDRHLGGYLRLVEGLRPLLDSDKDAWRQAMNAEYANIRAAIEWGLDRPDSGPARRLAAETAWLWHLEARGHEGLRLLRRAAERGGSGPSAEQAGAEQARLLMSIALVADTAGPEAADYDNARLAAEMATACGDAATARLARALDNIGMVAQDLTATREQAAALRDEALAAGDAFVADSSEVLVGAMHMLQDQNDLAVASLGPASERLLERGDRGVASTGFGCLALAMAWLGDLELAGDVAERAVAAAEPLRDFHRIGSARCALATVRGLQGRTDDAAAALEPIRRLVEGSDRPPFIPGWERTNALVELWRGRPGAAAAWCRRERSWPSEAESDDALLPDTQVVLASALGLVGDVEAASRLLDRAVTAARELRMPRVQAAAIEQRARLTDSDVRAIDLHHEALRIRSEHGLVLDCVDSLESLAERAQRRNSDEYAIILLGATRRARSRSGYAARPWGAITGPEPEPDDPALRDAYERGQAMDLDEAVAYASRARGPRGRPASGWESLTPTEQSVVDLAVDGLSNPQIAERLYMSRGTVKAHLGRVYAKLGVANRTELARLAGDREN